MKQYKLCIKIIIIIIIIIIKREKKNVLKSTGGKETEGRAREGVQEQNFNFIISFLCFFLRSTKIGPQVFVGTEGKVDLRDESYAWTPKSWSFVKLYEVENFPTCVICSIKAI